MLKSMVTMQGDKYSLASYIDEWQHREFWFVPNCIPKYQLLPEATERSFNNN